MLDWIWTNSGKLAELATVIAAVVAIVAIFFGWRQFTAQVHLQREATAKSIFRDYLMAAVDYPRFASPHLCEIDYKKETFDGEAETYQRYTWFVSVLLLASDQILQIKPTETWMRSIKVQLAYHWRYLLKDFEALRPEYSDVLGALVDEVVRERRFTRGSNPLSNLALSMAQRMLTPR